MEFVTADTTKLMGALLTIYTAPKAVHVSRRTTKGHRFDELFPAPVTECIPWVVRTLTARHFIIGHHRWIVDGICLRNESIY